MDWKINVYLFDYWSTIVWWDDQTKNETNLFACCKTWSLIDVAMVTQKENKRSEHVLNKAFI